MVIAYGIIGYGGNLYIMKTIENLTNRVFGRLTVIERDLSRKSKNETSRWYCLCLCGNKISVLRSSLMKGNTKSCGCLKNEKAALNGKKGIGVSKPIKEDLTGRIFGKLKVLQRDVVKIGLERGSFWICQCECGNICSTARHSLVNHGTQSCGCYQKTQARNKAMPDAMSDKNYWIGKYKRRAKNQNVEFSFSDKEFYDICSMNCFYCDREPVVRSTGYIRQNDVGVYKANGIDRIEPKKGYTIENSVPCCTPCNLMKTDKNQQEFINIAIRIAKKHGKKNVLQKS